MSGQLTFDGFQETEKKDRLLFLIYPPADIVAFIDAFFWRMFKKLGLSGKRVDPERYHITLQHLGDFERFPGEVANSALEIGEQLKSQPFQVAFEGLTSFSNHANHIAVLTGGSDHLVQFHQTLNYALARKQTNWRVQKGFTPHISLLYGNQKIDAQPVERISWTVREFCLVHSLLGKTQHICLGRWALEG